MILRRLGAAALLLSLCGPASGRELFASGERSLEVSGSVRQLVVRTKGTSGSRFAEAAAADPACAFAATFPDCSAWDLRGQKGVTQGLTRLRVRLDGVWSPRLSATLTWDNEFRVGTLDTLFGDARPVETFLGWEDEVHWFGLGSARDHRRWITRIYRGFVRYEGEPVELRVGRQRIAWGVGRIWNPTDRLSFVPPLSIEPDISPASDFTKGPGPPLSRA